MTLRWRPYSGTRISVAGLRTSIELPPTQPYGPPTKRYGCVWENGNKYFGYYEVEHPGEIEDVVLGPFHSLEEVKTRVESALFAQYPSVT